MTLFSTVELAPRDPILGITEQFAADPNPHKVNLGVGMYYDENGRLPLLKCVAAAEQAMVEAPAARGYLPIDGMADYDKAAQRLAFGDSSRAVAEQRIATAQALGGTGALKVAADFLKRLRPQSRVLISDPSWENHRALFTQAGFEVATYPYYDPVSHGVRFDAMLAALNAASAGHGGGVARLLPQPDRLRPHPRTMARGGGLGARPRLDSIARHGLPGLWPRAGRGRRRRAPVRRRRSRLPGGHLLLEELLALRRARWRAVGGVRAA